MIVGVDGVDERVGDAVEAESAGGEGGAYCRGRLR